MCVWPLSQALTCSLEPCPQVTYGSFDYTSLLYLSDYLDDFGGGRFVFIDEGANRTVEPRAGRMPMVRGHCCCSSTVLRVYPPTSPAPAQSLPRHTGPAA